MSQSQSPSTPHLNIESADYPFRGVQRFVNGDACIIVTETDAENLIRLAAYGIDHLDGIYKWRTTVEFLKELRARLVKVGFKGD